MNNTDGESEGEETRWMILNEGEREIKTSSAVKADKWDERLHNGKHSALCCVAYSSKPFIQLSGGWGYYVVMLIVTRRYSHWPLKQLSTFDESLCVGMD